MIHQGGSTDVDLLPAALLSENAKWDQVGFDEER
jgi:hypothetical protein